MYLSRVKLDTSRRETIRAISSPQIIHGAVESSVGISQKSPSEERKRMLWRIDYLADNCYLLLLSEIKPELSLLTTQFGFPNNELAGESKSYAPFLERLQEGQRWRFRLRANPVRSSSKEVDERTGRGKVFAHVTPDQQKQWLLKRAEACGFSLNVEEFAVTHSDWKRFRKNSSGRHQVVLRTATFEGYLTVTNVEYLRHALTNGIGRAKAYGCGLMTIMR